MFSYSAFMMPVLSPWNPEEIKYSREWNSYTSVVIVHRMIYLGHADPRVLYSWMLHWIALKASLEGMFKLWRLSHFCWRLFLSECLHSITEWEMALEQRRNSDAFYLRTLMHIDGRYMGRGIIALLTTPHLVWCKSTETGNIHSRTILLWNRSRIM